MEVQWIGGAIIVEVALMAADIMVAALVQAGQPVLAVADILVEDVNNNVNSYTLKIR